MATGKGKKFLQYADKNKIEKKKYTNLISFSYLKT